MNVVVDGLMTNYHKTGKGKTLVLLHGWGDTAKTFSPLIEGLQDNYEILALDLPGFGGTQAPPNAWGLDDYAKFTAAWLKKIKAKGVYAWVGHSYGGAVIIYGLGSKELTGQRLILLASAGVRNGNGLRKTLMKAGAKAAKLPLKLLPYRHQQTLRRKFYAAAGSDIMLLPHMELTFKRIIGEDIQEKARTITQPALLIYGSKDKDTPVAYGRRLNDAIEGSKLEVLNGAGHFLHQEEAEEVNMLIKKFLAEKA